MNEETSISTQSIGEVRDIIRDADTGEIIEDRGWQKNCIVNDLGKLVACLLKAQSGYSGILYWAIGDGLSSWDNTNPPAPSSTDTKLVHEIGRKSIPASAIQFVDSNGAVSATPTNRLLISLTFASTDINGGWREMAIVGGNATISADTGLLINHRTHQYIGKNTNISVDRQMRFTFN